jgi:UDP-N-acetylmuramate--alanine ligase
VVERDESRPDLGDLGRVHFVGIGGAGMSGIARIMLTAGLEVSGCDARDSRAIAALRARGAAVDVGHDAAHVEANDTVVVSSAIRPDNPDLVEANRLGRRVLPRAAALAAVMGGFRGIAVAGTHGKTTTTSMITVALQACGRDPSYAIGGDLNEPGSNAHMGTGDFFVAEADESDRSFLLLSPDVAIVTNVEADHLDNYGDAAAVQDGFRQFVGRIDRNGCLIVGADDEGARSLAPVALDAGLRVITFGLSTDADVRVDELRLEAGMPRFEVVAGGRRLGAVSLRVPGAYNAVNAAGALAVGMAIGLPFRDMVRGIEEFTGARRRFEFKGIARGVRVFDDYAHHPTELRALIGAAREVTGGGRLVTVFQPHLYSRTAAFADAFAAALAASDLAVVMEVYAAREDPMPGVTGALIADQVDLPPGKVVFEPSWTAVPAVIAGVVRPADVVLTVGAGDVTLLGPEILAAIEESAPLGEP